MIRPQLKQAIKALYDKGIPARDIKAQLSIDGCIYRLAIKKSWNTKQRRTLYKKKSKSRSAR